MWSSCLSRRWVEWIGSAFVTFSRCHLGKKTWSSTRSRGSFCYFKHCNVTARIPLFWNIRSYLIESCGVDDKLYMYTNNVFSVVCSLTKCWPQAQLSCSSHWSAQWRSHQRSDCKAHACSWYVIAPTSYALLRFEKMYILISPQFIKYKYAIRPEVAKSLKHNCCVYVGDKICTLNPVNIKFTIRRRKMGKGK